MSLFQPVSTQSHPTAVDDWVDVKTKANEFILQKKKPKPKDDPPKSTTDVSAAPGEEFRLLFAGTHVIATAASIAAAEGVLAFVVREIGEIRKLWAAQQHTPTQAEPLEALTDLAARWVAETPHRCIIELKYDDAFKYILKNPSSLQHIDSQGFAILHHLVRVNEPEVLKSLLSLPKVNKDMSLDVNVRDRSGFTPLHWACHKMNFRVAEILIKEANAAVCAATETKFYTAMHFLAGYQDSSEEECVAVLNLLAERGADVDARSFRGETPLLQSAVHGAIIPMKWFLDNRAEINVTSSIGETALHGAVRAGNKQAVELLLSRRIDTHIRSAADGSTAFQLAETLHKTELAQILTDYMREPHKPASESDASAKRLRKLSIAQSNMKRTVLHDAVIKGNHRLVTDILLDKIHKIDAKDPIKWTPLLYAASHGYMDIAITLIKAGAELSCVDLDQSGILHFVARNRIRDKDKAALAEFMSLVTTGPKPIDLNAQNIHGATALHEACTRDNLPVVTSLILVQAKIDIQTKNGETALMYASRAGNVNVVRYLLTNGANTLLTGKYGTALDVARGACYIDVVKLLLFNTERSEMEKRKLRQSSGVFLGAEPGLGEATMKLAMYPVNATKNLFTAAINVADNAITAVAGPSLAASASAMSAPRPTPALPTIPSEDRRKSWEDFRKRGEDWKKTVEQEMPADNGTSATLRSERVWKPPVDFKGTFFIESPLLVTAYDSVVNWFSKAKPNTLTNKPVHIAIWTTHITFVTPDQNYGTKLSWSSISGVIWQSSLFQASRITILTRDGEKLEIMKCEELHPMKRVLDYCFEHKLDPHPWKIGDTPIEDAIGSIKYPDENATFHGEWKDVPQNEYLVDFCTCQWKEKSNSGKLYISKKRICFGKRDSINIPYSEITALRRLEKGIQIETAKQNINFIQLLKRDYTYQMIEKFWMDDLSLGRIVLFAASGRQTQEAARQFVDSLASKHDDAYFRWIIPQPSAVIDAEKDALKAINVLVCPLSSRNLAKATSDYVSQMSTLVLVALEPDPDFASTAELLIRSCTKSMKHVVLLSTQLCDMNSTFYQAVINLESLVARTGFNFTFVHANAAIMQLFEEPFVNIKQDWRFCLPVKHQAMAWVDLRDIVDVLTTVSGWSDDRSVHNGKIYYISGPEALSCDDVANVFTTELDMEVRYLYAPPEQIKVLIHDTIMNRTPPKESTTTAPPKPSALMLRLRHKVVSPDYESKEMCEQYSQMFLDMSSFDLHGLVSTLTEDILGRPCRAFRDYVQDKIEHFREDIIIYFPAQQYEMLIRQFQAIVARQASQLRMEKTEFTKALGPVISSAIITERIYRFFDRDLRDGISLSEWVSGLSILVNGTLEQQIEFSFEIMDLDNDGRIALADLKLVSLALNELLTLVGINNVAVKDLFDGPMVKGYPCASDGTPKESITLDEYSVLLMANRLYFESLGGLMDTDLAEEKNQIFRSRGVSVGLNKNLLSAIPTNNPIKPSPRGSSIGSDDKPLSPPSSPPPSPRIPIPTPSPDQSPSYLSSSPPSPLPDSPSIHPPTPLSKSDSGAPKEAMPSFVDPPSLSASQPRSAFGSEPAVAPPTSVVSPAGLRRPRRHTSVSLRFAPLRSESTPNSPGFDKFAGKGITPVTTPSLMRSVSHALRPPLRRGLLLTPGNQSWDLGLRIALGVSKTIERNIVAASTPGWAFGDGSLAPADFDVEIEENVGTKSEDSWTFVDYAPRVFDKIRQSYGVGRRHYLHSLGLERILGNLILGRLSSFEEVISTGRSGSFFLRSPDNKYLIKTLPTDEHAFFRRILKSYYSHLEKYPNTLLCRFFGLHRLKNSKQDLYFVVMANLFDTELEVHEQYDLKGSTVNRFVAEKLEFWNPNVAMKDLDFHRRIRIGGLPKARILEQIEMDTMWMASHNICDYSLLVGIHFADAELPGQEKDADRSAFRSFIGGMNSSNTDRGDKAVFFIGLIDILTQYDLNKKGENFLKSLVYNKNEISAIAPEPYRARFMRYVCSIVD